MLLNKEQIRQAADIQTQDIEVPEWGGTVRLKSLTGAERDRFEAGVVQGQGRNTTVNMTSYAEDKTVQVSLDAPHILLDDADAENYSTAVTGEILGTGDGTTTEFLTAEKNVGGIRRVTVGGVLKLPGIDYDIADTDTYDTQAKITFKSAPSTGEAVACDYFCWHTSLPIHQAVSGLLDSMWTA